MIPPKGFSYLLLALLALGGPLCPCPADAHGAAESSSHHGSHHESTLAKKDGCGHSQCVTDCDEVAAESSRQDAALPCTAKYPVDDFDAVEAATVASFGRSSSITLTGPPTKHLQLPHETPVRRFERMLD